MLVHVLKKITKILSIFAIVLILCACSNEKLYKKKEIIEHLNKKYNTEFIILEQNKIDNGKIQYKVAFKDNEKTFFTIVNELVITGSDIGPKHNELNDSEIDKYFIEKNHYDEDVIKEKMINYLKSNYNQNFDVYTYPNFYCEDGSNICGYSGYVYWEDDSLSQCKIMIYNGNIEDNCSTIFTK